ncbi:PhoX family phosphatase [Occultella glacieicola]|uniref:PhoX family phosphatase n=1 Tax=Occultella glacieicola TaxID=2518684 RepID=A0ABY2E3P4_9MICO|nr:PhoX family phosphatase [Occultella glacieicola]TDE94120.1 PhoX family phosphatase [Occultella glacieicola]
MPTSPRKLLPLLPNHSSNRSPMTCLYRCGDACFHEVPNASAGAYLGDIIAAGLSRRSLLKVGAVVAVAGAGAAALGAQPASAAPNRAARGLAFTPVAPNSEHAVTVPEGYTSKVLVRWGDPLFSDAPEFDPENQTAAGQARQFGYNNDHLDLFEIRRDEHVMVINHEYTNEEIMFPGYDPAAPTQEQVEIAWAAHGLTVVGVTGAARGRPSGELTTVVDHRLNRRLTATTEFRLSGPVVGSDYVKTAADPRGRDVLGTLNNCAGGITPWNTWLTAEENFNQYFANADAVTDPVVRERLRRYGLGGGASQRKWEAYDSRFDLGQEPNEVNRFGWIVEVDPFDPESTPRKRTALGRFKHEAANVHLGQHNHVVAYMGDDERFDYLYKFVSRDQFRRNDPEHNDTLLDNGTLYVARFTGNSPAEEIDGSGTLPSDGAFDGAGEWIPLVTSDERGATSHVEGMTGIEVLVFTRQAGDAVQATKMDRPEDVETNPLTGVLYVALTNNSNRGTGTNPGPDETNPRSTNRHGHVIELLETGNDPLALAFGWRIFLLCGDPNDPSTYFAGYDKSQVSPISCPDNVTFDPYGNLWISTDGNALGTNDGLFGVAVDGEYRGQVKQFLTVPTSAETCGPKVTETRVLVCVQHPGEASGASFENQFSHWPDGGTSVPRPSVVVAWRPDGIRIGR